MNWKILHIELAFQEKLLKSGNAYNKHISSLKLIKELRYQQILNLGKINQIKNLLNPTFKINENPEMNKQKGGLVFQEL